MLAYIEGRLLERAETSCVLVTAGGVGYEIFLPEHALASLPAQGGMASFFTSFIVREDAQELFGFPTWDERQTFVLLRGINRVGARTALAILSQYRPDDLRRIVLRFCKLRLRDTHKRALYYVTVGIICGVDLRAVDEVNEVLRFYGKTAVGGYFR